MRKTINKLSLFLMSIAILGIVIDFNVPKIRELCLAIFLVTIGIQIMLPVKKGKKNKQEKENKKVKIENKKEDPNEFVCEGITRKAFNEIINSGRAQIKRIEEIGLKIMDHKVRINILDICQVANEIYDDFIQDPKDIKTSRRFINYYLETTEKIVDKYYKLANCEYLTKEGTESLQEVEKTLELIEESFKKHLKKLLDNDILDLDAEIKVLKDTMKAESARYQ